MQPWRDGQPEGRMGGRGDGGGRGTGVPSDLGKRSVIELVRIYKEQIPPDKKQ